MKRAWLVALVLALATTQLAIRSHAVYASGSLLLSTSTPTVGTTVTVHGVGFASLHHYTVSTDLPGAPQVQTVTACFDAGFCTIGTFSYSFVVPAGTPPGTYHVTAIDNSTFDAVSAPFTVNGLVPPPLFVSINASPTTVQPGQTFGVYGVGWTPGTAVCVGLQLAFVSPCTDVPVNGIGGFSVSLVMPGSIVPGATVTIGAAQEGAPSVQATTTVQVAVSPTFTLSANPVQAGEILTVSGTNFGLGTATVTILNTLSLPIATQTGPVYGGTISINVTIPVGTVPGNYTVQVSNNGIQVGQTGLQISGSPAISFNPSPGTAGQPVTILGTSFPQVGINLQANFTLTTGASQPVQVYGAVSSAGTFTTTLTIPAGTAPGSYTVNAFSIGSPTPLASGVLVVQVPASIVGSPTTLAVGFPVSVIGTGFGANEAVQVALSLNGTTYQTVNGLAGPTGTFSINVPVPAGAPPGAYTLTATGLSTHASAQGTVSVTTAPVLNASPSVTGPRQTVTLSGENFAPNSAVSLTGQIPLPGGASQSFSASPTTDANGRFSASVPIPANAAAGSAAFTASQTQGGSVVTKTAAVTIQALSPGMVLATPSVAAGSSVQVSLSGFAPGPNAPITLSTEFQTANGKSPQVVPYSFNVDPNSAGNALTTLSVPVNASPGTVTITATQTGSGASTTQQMSVTSPAPPVTPPPAKKPLKIQSASVKWTVARQGTSDQVNVQVNPADGVTLAIDISFPSGTILHVKGTPNGKGQFHTAFSIPGNAIKGNSKTVLVQIEASRGSEHVTRTLTFKLIK